MDYICTDPLIILPTIGKEPLSPLLMPSTILVNFQTTFKMTSQPGISGPENPNFLLLQSVTPYFHLSKGKKQELVGTKLCHPLFALILLRNR